VKQILTVGITTRNRPEALRACLASLAHLTPLDPEVLVFDDGSQPEAAADAKGIEARVIRDRAAPGYIVGRNRLVAEACGAFVLLVDDDTRVIESRAVEDALRVLQRDARVGAVAFAQAEADGRPWPAAMQPSPVDVPSVVASFIGFAHVVRRDAFLALGGYRETFEFYGEEKEFCLRLLDAGYQTVYLPDARIAHVIDRGSRDQRRYLRFVSRNDCLNSVLNDPFARLLWVLPARYFLYFRMRRGWKIRDPWGGLWLLGELMRRAPAAWQARKPVRRQTLQRWRSLRTAPPAYRVPLQVDGAGGR